MKRTQPSAVIVFTVLTGVALAACSPRDNAARDSVALRTDSAAGRVDSAGRATATAATDSAMRADSTGARNGWTESSILGFTWAADNGEVALGQLGAKKATNPKVKAFAQELVNDHKTMRASAKSMADKLNAQLDTTANDVHDLLNHAQDEVKSLTDEAAGADWDKDFINKQIDDHQNVLDKLQDAAKSATNADLRAALEKATGKVQQHLTKAKDIKANVLKD